MKLFVILCLVSCILFFLSCEKSTTPLTSSKVVLTVEYVGVSEAELHLQLYSSQPYNALQLLRDGQTVLSAALSATDTTLRDTALLPAHSYTYQAALFDNGGRSLVSNELTLTTLDTSSHDYVWTINTFGNFNSSLYDVFAIAEDDVWAVGKIDTGSNQPFNAIHWDGHNWDLERIYAITSLGDTSRGPITAIFAFSTDDIWTFSYAGSYSYFDGNSWISEFVDERVGSINKIWGNSSSDIYFIGTNGNITHYNGEIWHNVESGTQLRLTDIWGLSENDIYVVGADMSSPDNVVLHYDGTSWYHLATDQNRKVGVWGISPDNLYFAGDGVYHYDGKNYHLIDWPAGIPHIFSQCVRGSQPNNVFVVGDFGLVLHFNGSSWKGYTDLLNPSGTVLKSISIADSSVFVVGSADYKGIVIHGRKQN